MCRFLLQEIIGVFNTRTTSKLVFQSTYIYNSYRLRLAERKPDKTIFTTLVLRLHFRLIANNWEKNVFTTQLYLIY